VISRHTDVSRTRLDHLQHGAEHADHGAIGSILATALAAKAVEVAEKLVRAVDEMNDHSGLSPWCGSTPRRTLHGVR
jgi:hypothetical protein